MDQQPNEIPIADIFQRLEKEAEMKLWNGIYIVGDTNVHPDIVTMMSEMINSLEYKYVVELGPHHGVLSRYFAIHCVDTAFDIIGLDCEELRDNITGYDNIRHFGDIPQTAIAEVDCGIINMGLGFGKPDYIAILFLVNRLQLSAKKDFETRLIVFGYDPEEWEWLEKRDGVILKWRKMQAAIYGFQV